ncbi:MAG: hypothetical protein AB7S69_00935 [Salinivirgaceae bacterium]
MKNKIIILIILLNSLFVSRAQTFVEINQKAQQVVFDALGNLYLINDVELLKYNASGTLLNRYSRSLNGPIHSVDATNAMQVLVFYKEAGLVSFLDRELVQLSDAFETYAVFGSEISLVCASSSGGFWAFCPEQQKLFRVNDQRKILVKTQALNEWIGNCTVNAIYENNQKIYVNCQNKLLVFDLFGAYLSTIHRENMQRVFFSERHLIIYDGTMLFKMQAPFLKQQDQSISLPASGIDLAWNKNHMAILINDKVLIYNDK